MNHSSDENDQDNQILKVKINLAVDAICKQALEERSNIAKEKSELVNDFKADTCTVYTLSELVAEFSRTLAFDLAAFSKHAKRSTITVDDVKLCGRKSSSVSKSLEAFANNLASNKKANKPVKKKKRIVADSDSDSNEEAPPLVQESIIDTDFA